MVATISKGITLEDLITKLIESRVESKTKVKFLTKCGCAFVEYIADAVSEGKTEKKMEQSVTVSAEEEPMRGEIKDGQSEIDTKDTK